MHSTCAYNSNPRQGKYRLEMDELAGMPRAVWSAQELLSIWKSSSGKIVILFLGCGDK
jgi:hypothetical protein